MKNKIINKLETTTTEDWQRANKIATKKKQHTINRQGAVWHYTHLIYVTYKTKNQIAGIN